MPHPAALFVLPGGVGAPLNWWHYYTALWHHWGHHWGTTGIGIKNLFSI